MNKEKCKFNEENYYKSRREHIKKDKCLRCWKDRNLISYVIGTAVMFAGLFFIVFNLIIWFEMIKDIETCLKNYNDKIYLNYYNSDKVIEITCEQIIESYGNNYG